MTHLIESFGLALLFVLIASESAGIPLPGETALITAGVLAANGKLNIVAVLAVSAAAAIVGDNIGYWIGRTWGRRVLERWPRLQRFGDRVIPIGERFFERHGAKTVFFGRFFALLRVTSAWLAGVSKMPWWKFFFWNASGGICWVLLIGLIAYYAGRAAADAISHYGLLGGGIVLGLLLIAFAIFHFWRRRMLGAEPEP
ncbi:MAG: DedA family protein [Actinomycetota bacterium]|nr:DedA family protein [Actinomycetota bacterium]